MAEGFSPDQDYYTSIGVDHNADIKKEEYRPDSLESLTRELNKLSTVVHTTITGIIQLAMSCNFSPQLLL